MSGEKPKKAMLVSPVVFFEPAPPKKSNLRVTGWQLGNNFMGFDVLVVNQIGTATEIGRFGHN